MLIFKNIFPNAFITSTERTGISLFEDDNNMANPHNRLIKRITLSPLLDINEIIAEFYNSPYPLPITRNISFNSQLKDIMKMSSYIEKEHSGVLTDFSNISGGDYPVDREGLWFIPQKTRGVKLSMGESSSSVRSLLDVGFYLKHIAQKGDFAHDLTNLN